eukprot:g8652.t1
MKFGALLVRSRVAEWSEHYLDYNQGKSILKKCLKKFLAEANRRHGGEDDKENADTRKTTGREDYEDGEQQSSLQEKAQGRGASGSNGKSEDEEQADEEDGARRRSGGEGGRGGEEDNDNDKGNTSNSDNIPDASDSSDSDDERERESVAKTKEKKKKKKQMAELILLVESDEDMKELLYRELEPFYEFLGDEMLKVDEHYIKTMSALANRLEEIHNFFLKTAAKGGGSSSPSGGTANGEGGARAAAGKNILKLNGNGGTEGRATAAGDVEERAVEIDRATTNRSSAAERQTEPAGKPSRKLSSSRGPSAGLFESAAGAPAAGDDEDAEISSFLAERDALLREEVLEVITSNKPPPLPSLPSSSASSPTAAAAAGTKDNKDKAQGKITGASSAGTQQPSSSKNKTATKSSKLDASLMKQQTDLILFRILKEIRKLEDFCRLNFSGYRKLMKKHDKKSGLSTLATVLPYLAEHYIFPSYESRLALLTKEVKELAEKYGSVPVEDYWKFETNDSSGGGARGSSSFYPQGYLLSFFLGVTVMALLDLGVLVDLPATNGTFEVGKFFDVFPLFRFSFMFTLMLWLLGWVIATYEKYSINYIFILDIDPKCQVKARDFFQYAVLQTIVWVLFFGMYVYFTKFSDPDAEATKLIPVEMFPLTLMVLQIVFLFLPSDSFRRKYRWQILYVIGDVMSAPFVFVTFGANIVGDILTSFVKPLADLEYTVCYFYGVGRDHSTAEKIEQALDAGRSQLDEGAGRGYQEVRTSTTPGVFDRTEIEQEHCHAVAGVLVPFVLALPYYFRFMQCVARFLDQRDHEKKQIEHEEQMREVDGRAQQELLVEADLEVTVAGGEIEKFATPKKFSSEVDTAANGGLDGALPAAGANPLATPLLDGRDLLDMTQKEQNNTPRNYSDAVIVHRPGTTSKRGAFARRGKSQSDFLVSQSTTPLRTSQQPTSEAFDKVHTDALTMAILDGRLSSRLGTSMLVSPRGMTSTQAQHHRILSSRGNSREVFGAGSGGGHSATHSNSHTPRTTGGGGNHAHMQHTLSGIGGGSAADRATAFLSHQHRSRVSVVGGTMVGGHAHLQMEILPEEGPLQLLEYGDHGLLEKSPLQHTAFVESTPERRATTAADPAGTIMGPATKMLLTPRGETSALSVVAGGTSAMGSPPGAPGVGANTTSCAAQHFPTALTLNPIDVEALPHVPDPVIEALEELQPRKQMTRFYKIPHFWNAGKYLTGILVTFQTYLSEERWVWGLISVTSTLYMVSWDVYMDWNLVWNPVPYFLGKLKKIVSELRESVWRQVGWLVRSSCRGGAAGGAKSVAHDAAAGKIIVPSAVGERSSDQYPTGLAGSSNVKGSATSLASFASTASLASGGPPGYYTTKQVDRDSSLTPFHKLKAPLLRKSGDAQYLQQAEDHDDDTEDQLEDGAAGPHISRQQSKTSEADGGGPDGYTAVSAGGAATATSQEVVEKLPQHNVSLSSQASAAARTKRNENRSKAAQNKAAAKPKPLHVAPNRQKMYPEHYYLWIPFWNFFLRFTWILTIVPDAAQFICGEEEQCSVALSSNLIVFLAAAGELYRRAQWALIRLENEHLTNASHYRAFCWVPPMGSGGGKMSYL